MIYHACTGNREAVHQTEGSHIPLPSPMASVHEGHHSQSTLPVQMISAERHRFSNHDGHTDRLPDVCDRPLEFERRHDSNHESHQEMNYGHAVPATGIGMADHDPLASSVHAWTPSTAPGFSQIPMGPAGAKVTFLTCVCFISIGQLLAQL